MIASLLRQSQDHLVIGKGSGSAENCVYSIKLIVENFSSPGLTYRADTTNPMLTRGRGARKALLVII